MIRIWRTLLACYHKKNWWLGQRGLSRLPKYIPKARPRESWNLSTAGVEWMENWHLLSSLHWAPSHTYIYSRKAHISPFHCNESLGTILKSSSSHPAEPGLRPKPVGLESLCFFSKQTNKKTKQQVTTWKAKPETGIIGGAMRVYILSFLNMVDEKGAMKQTWKAQGANWQARQAQ